MQIIHYATDLIEAQMVGSMLESQGIPAKVNGINLIGAAGELPVNDMLNIAVADVHSEQAKQLIKDYLSAEIIEDSDALD